MTPLLRAVCIILRIIVRSPVWLPQWIRRKDFDLTGLRYYEGIHFDRARLYSMEAGKQAKKLEPYAMKWLFTDNDFSDGDMDKFLEGLPGYISSNHTEKGQLDEYLTAEHIKTRIKGHFITCATSVELSEEESITRVSSCVRALRLIFDNSPERNGSSPVQDKNLQSQQMYIQDIIDPKMALRASCIRSLVLVSSVSEDSSHFPVSLIPLYNLFFPNNKADTGDPDEKESEGMWKGLLHDAPLANLTMLAKAVRENEHAPPSSFSFCWKTFDILLSQFGAIHSDTSSDNLTPAQSDFDNLHQGTRKYVHGEEMGFRMTPLLEILDIVDRGRRLLTYQSRATVVFGKEYLRNGDLLEAFAHCLPNFIAKNSRNVCMDLMEKVMILWITQNSTSPTSDKFRVFECCCDVLDAAFLILEGSRKVDWRAPEFGSLWQHFESFVTHGFQGAFMGRATSFRIGIIKARFCKVFLAQFCKNILSFRSQWDVASLAKLITISVYGMKTIQNSGTLTSRGPCWGRFTAKALKMVNIIATDGPLSIFCQLGHLATSTIPSHHSGLQREDIEKVLELQDKLAEDKRLPLNGASDTVIDLFGATSGGTGDTGNAGDEDEGNLSAGEERELLKSLLWKIDHVRNLRVTRSEGPSHSGYSEKRPTDVSQESGPHTILSSPSTVQSTLNPRGSPTTAQNPQP
ncbi:hypothetical protein BGY98DRAFT_990938 [Russula aff. rugulosa BPL654]|nr:hypothetical protein BGY98DRAFT_990938 [Russula aff. rugulosa BPL654]